MKRILPIIKIGTVAALLVFCLTSLAQALPIMVVDNPGAVFEGDWGTSTNYSDDMGNLYPYPPVGSDLRWAAPHGETRTATYTFDIEAGEWSIFAWWTTHGNTATNALYLITHDGLPDPVFVTANQKEAGSGGQWNFLYTSDFPAGILSVQLSNQGANGYVIADAVGIGPPVPEPATMLLLGSGLAGIGLFGRKRFRK